MVAFLSVVLILFAACSKDNDNKKVGPGDGQPALLTVKFTMSYRAPVLTDENKITTGTADFTNVTRLSDLSTKNMLANITGTALPMSGKATGVNAVNVTLAVSATGYQAYSETEASVGTWRAPAQQEMYLKFL